MNTDAGQQRSEQLADEPPTAFEADASAGEDTPAFDSTAPRPRRRAWAPDAHEEVALALRRLSVRPWAIAGRDDELLAIARRHSSALQEVFARLGWVLVIERDLVRLRKTPPVRRGWNDHLPAGAPMWFFLLVAAAESLPQRCHLATLVNAARAAAPEAGIVTTGLMPERLAIVAALHMLDYRGVIVHLEGDVDGFLRSDDAQVLLAVHHNRLLHVIANAGGPELATDPQRWLERVSTEADVPRRMRRRLIDDTLVHSADLDEAEGRWLSARVRGDDGGPLAAAFGLELERRAEGAAFVIPDGVANKPWERGEFAFPTHGTVAHASLKLVEHFLSLPPAPPGTGPGPGWRGLASADVRAWLERTCAAQSSGKGGWSAEYIESPDRLGTEIRRLLTGLGVLRCGPHASSPEATVPSFTTPDTTSPPGPVREATTWWLSPAAARWRLQPEAPSRPGLARPKPSGPPPPPPPSTASLFEPQETL